MAGDTGALGTVAVVDGAGGPDNDVVGALRGAGYDVVSTSTVADCVDLLEDRTPDAVVGPTTSPDGDGLALVRRVRAVRPALPVVLAPAADDGSESLAGRAVAAGAEGYVPAAEGADAVVERVRECTGRDAGAPPVEGENRYRSLVETSPAPINVFDADGTCVWGNDAVLDLLGLDDRDELVGRSIFEFVHDDDRGTAEAELRAVVEDKRATGPTEMTLVRDDGERRQILVSTAPGTYGGRDVGQAVVVDVTPLWEVRRELREERRFVQRALDALHDVFVVIGPDGELRRWNERALSVTGYDAAAFADLALVDLVADGDGDRALASVATVLETGTDVVELEVQAADGTTIPYEFRCRRLEDADGEVAGVAGIGRDVSDRRERERQLQMFEQMLRHNIRTELNVVLGVAGELESGEVDDVAASARLIRERGEHLYEEADKVKRLVELLTETPDPVVTDLEAAVDRGVAAATAQYPGAEVTVTGGDGVAGMAVPQFGEAVAELVGNAVAHSDRPTPSVAVTVDGTNEGPVVAVADDGPGIPAIEREVLTTDRPITQLEHGSGVGLWFVYWVVRLSEGRIRFEDNEPRGSVVAVDLAPPG